MSIILTAAIIAAALLVGIIISPRVRPNRKIARLMRIAGKHEGALRARSAELSGKKDAESDIVGELLNLLKKPVPAVRGKKNKNSEVTPKEVKALLRRVRLAHKVLDSPEPRKKDRGTHATGKIDKQMMMDEYKLHLDLYKHYLTVVATFSAFYYGITGGILAYYFNYASAQNKELISLSVVFPAIMSFTFAVVFFKLWRLYEKVERDTKVIAAAFGFERREVHALTMVLHVCAYFYVFNTLSLTVLSVYILCPGCKAWLAGFQGAIGM